MNDENDVEQQDCDTIARENREFPGVSGKVFLLTITGLIVLALGLGLGLGLGLKDNDDNTNLAFQNDLSWMSEPITLPSNLWSGENGVYGGYSPADIPGGLSESALH